MLIKSTSIYNIVQKNIFVLVLLVFSLNVNGQKTEFGNQVFLTYRTLEKIHYKPRALNDKFSEDVFQIFINELDPYHTHFLKSDIDEFNNLITELDDEIAEGKYSFVSQVSERYKFRLEESKNLAVKILSNPLNFNSRDTLQIKQAGRLEYPASLEQKEKDWVNILKYRMLIEYYGRPDRIKEKKEEIGSIAEDEILIRNNVLKKSQSRIDKALLSHYGYEQYIQSIFLNSMAQAFDPHSNFFMPREKEVFREALSTHARSFGFIAENGKDDEIIVAYVIPGGPAWKSNSINPNDEIVAIEWGKNNSLNLTDAMSEDINSMIAGIPSEIITVTVLKNDGSLKSVKLAKAMLKVEENTVTGFILKGEKNVGYIRLPDFYTSSWNYNNAQGCSNDVAKEILKLQKDSISGLILDLRYNGGGSLNEALSLIGIFIDEGPLTIAHYSGVKPVVLKDMNRGTIYNGPLMVMINRASASELVAASLQDYNRAVITGSSSYGKGTAQIIVPVDTSQSLTKINPDTRNIFGFLKITCKKIYRLDGSTYQMKGVEPDIEIPDFTSHFILGEKENEFCLKADSIQKKVLFNKKDTILKKDLEIKIENLVKNDSILNSIKTYLMNEESLVPDFITLLPDDYISLQKKLASEIEKMKTMSECNNSPYIVKSNTYHAELLNLDEEIRKINTEEQNILQTDIYVQIAFKILLKIIN